MVRAQKEGVHWAALGWVGSHSSGVPWLFLYAPGKGYFSLFLKKILEHFTCRSIIYD
jgi:hypothetical protein